MFDVNRLAAQQPLPASTLRGNHLSKGAAETAAALASEAVHDEEDEDTEDDDDDEFSSCDGATLQPPVLNHFVVIAQLHS